MSSRQMPPPFTKNLSDIDVGDCVRAGGPEITKSKLQHRASIRLNTETRWRCGP